MSLKDIAISTAQFLLPKSTERVLGIAGPEKPKPLPATDVFDPILFRDSIKSSVQDQIKSGILDSSIIRSNVKSQIQQKIDQGFLQKVVPAQPPSIGGFVKNAQRNTSEIVDGLGTLLGIGIKATLNPIDSMKNIGGFTTKMIASPQYREEVKNTYVDPIINDYKEYRHPLTKMYEDPLSVLLDVTALLSMGGTLAAKTGAKTAETIARTSPTATAVRDARSAVSSAKTGDDMRVAALALQEAKKANAVAPIISETPSFKTAKFLQKTGETMQNAGTFASMKNISSATKGVIRAMPGGEDVVRNWDIAAATRKGLQKEQASFLASRNRVVNDINTKVNKLTPDEVKLLPQVAEGMAQTPSGASTHFYEAVGLMRALAKDQERFGLKIGSLSRDIVERRKWAPLAKWAESNGLMPPKQDLANPLTTEARKYKTAEEFVNSFLQHATDVPEKIRGGSIEKGMLASNVSDDIASANPSYFYKTKDGKIFVGKNSGEVKSIFLVRKGDVTRAQTIGGVTRGEGKLGLKPVAEFPVGTDIKSQLTDIWKKAQGDAKTSESFGTSFDNLTGAELYGQIETLKRLFPGVDPIYMRHFFADKPKNFFNFFLNTKPVKSFKPGFLKKYRGVEGYIGEGGKVTKEDLINVLERQSAENLKWQRNIGLIESIKAHPLTKPLEKGIGVLPGYRVFAPDGMIRFYKETIDLSKELKKKVALKDDVWSIFEDAVDAAFPKDISYVGVTKARIYQVPEAMAVELQKNVASTNPWMKLFYDKPLDAFRFTSLAIMPRWLINNVIGNAVFSTIKGDVFNPTAFTTYLKLRKSDGIFPDELFGGVHQIEKTTSGRLGGAAEIPLVKSTVAMHDKLLDVKIIGQMIRVTEGMMGAVIKPIIKLGNLSFKINGATDDMFKGVSYINSALKNERKNFLTRMTTSFDDSLKALEKVGSNPALMGKIVDDIHSWYYHGLNLTNFERRTMRRVIPFYSWMRWSTLYAYRVATEAPVRADIIAHMASDYYMFTGQDKLPEYLKGSVAMGTDEDGTVYYLQTRGLNPFSFIGDLMDKGFAEAALAGAAPAVKTFAEQATGRDTFLGKPFTKEGLTQMFNGDLYKFDPDTGKTVKVEEKIKPSLIENLLRNYLPQYLLLEASLSGGQKRYTSEGLTTILSDLFKDPKERDSIIKDVITRQGEEKTTLKKELGKAFALNIQDVTPEDRVKRQEALDKATKAILNKEVPILNQDFKKLLRQRIMDEVAKGTPPDKIKEDIKVWIGINVDKLKQLRQ